jgi:hypothetical protein
MVAGAVRLDLGAELGDPAGVALDRGVVAGVTGGGELGDGQRIAGDQRLGNACGSEAAAQGAGVQRGALVEGGGRSGSVGGGLGAARVWPRGGETCHVVMFTPTGEPVQLGQPVAASGQSRSTTGGPVAEPSASVLVPSG